MSVRVATTSLIPGAVVCGDRGLGVTGAVIRATTGTGTHGPGLLYLSWDSSADDTKEFMARITSAPSSGTLFVNEDGSFILSGAADGLYTIGLDVYADGVLVGPTTATVTIGTVHGAATVTLDSIELSAPTGTAAGEATGDATASGALAAITLTAPTGAANATGDAAASGSLAAVTLTAPTGAATGGGATLPTIGRPASDTSTGAWTPSTGSALYPMVDEVTPDDADYISTSTASTCEMALNATAYPGGAAQVFRVRASSATGSSLVITLKQGSTVIATRTQVLTATLTTYSYTLTPEEIALITAGALSISLQAV